MKGLTVHRFWCISVGSAASCGRAFIIHHSSFLVLHSIFNPSPGGPSRVATAEPAVSNNESVVDIMAARRADSSKPPRRGGSTLDATVGDARSQEANWGNSARHPTPMAAKPVMMMMLNNPAHQTAIRASLKFFTVTIRISN